MYVYKYIYSCHGLYIHSPSAPVSCGLKSNDLDLHGRACEGGRVWELGSLAELEIDFNTLGLQGSEFRVVGLLGCSGVWG